MIIATFNEIELQDHLNTAKDVVLSQLAEDGLLEKEKVEELKKEYFIVMEKPSIIGGFLRNLWWKNEKDRDRRWIMRITKRCFLDHGRG